MTDILAVDIDGTVQSIVDRSVNIGLRLVIFAVILLVGWLVSRGFYRLARRLLDRIGFNRLAERSRLGRWTGQYRPSNLVAKIVYYGLLLFTLQLAFGAFGANPVSTMINGIVAWLPKLLVACVIVVVAAAIGNAIFDIIHNALGRLPYSRPLARTVQVAVLALGIIAALNQVGVATTVTTPMLITALATLGGIAVVGVGGGLIRPMTQRWERALRRLETETGRAASQVREYAQRRDAEKFGQSLYQGRTGSQAREDVRRAAGKAAEEARPSVPSAPTAPGL